MRNLGLQILLASGVAIMAGSAQAAPITSLYNTGVDASGNPLANNSAEIHYSLISVPGGSSTDLRVLTAANNFPVGPWLGDDALSAWVVPTGASDATAPSGLYTYRISFDLTGFDAATASIIGQWATDDPGLDILVNGATTGFASGGFSSFSSFSLSGNFVAGINTLDFVLNNGGGPTGLRVEMSGDARVVTEGGPGVPEPASMTLIAAGVGVIAFFRRRLA